MKTLLLTILIAGGLILSGQTAQAMPGMYHTYEAKAFAEASSYSRVLFFYAGWCPMCRNADKALTQNQLPDGVMIYKVDFDQAQDLKNRYGVNVQDTFVLVDSNGNKIAQWVGLDSAMADNFMAQSQNILLPKSK